MDTNPQIPLSVLPITHHELHQHAHAHSLSQQSLARRLTRRGIVELYGWKIRWPSYTKYSINHSIFSASFLFRYGRLAIFSASFLYQSINLSIRFAGFKFQF
jgi:hypothetical protein